MSLLTVAQTVLREVGFPDLSSIVSNTDESARRLYGLANRSGKALMKRHNWTVLQKEHTFSTGSGTAYYDLPSDFDRFIPITGWDRTNYWALQGPISPQEWQVIKSGITQTGPRRRYRIKPLSGTRKIYLDPTPTSTNSLVFEYISSKWCASSGGTAQTAYAADADAAYGDLEYLIELDVKWRFQEILGQPYLEARDEFDRAWAAEKARDGDQPRLSLNGSRRYSQGMNIPESGYG